MFGQILGRKGCTFCSFSLEKIRNVKEYQPHPSNKTHIGVSHLFAEASRWTSGSALFPEASLCLV